MVSLPARVRDVFREWSDEFSGSVWPRFQVLVFAAIVCVGRHTVCRLLRIAGALAEGHWSSYHRVLSKRRWSTWRLARSLAQHVVERFVPCGPIALVGDETVTQHPGIRTWHDLCRGQAFVYSQPDMSFGIPQRSIISESQAMLSTATRSRGRTLRVMIRRRINCICCLIPVSTSGTSTSCGTMPR